MLIVMREKVHGIVWADVIQRSVYNNAQGGLIPPAFSRVCTYADILSMLLLGPIGLLALLNSFLVFVLVNFR